MQASWHAGKLFNFYGGKMKSSQLLVFIITLCFISLSCSKNDNGSDPNPNIESSILPLSVGNSWNFQFTQLDSAGNIVKSSLEPMAISTTRFLDGRTWYQFNEVLFDTKQIFTAIDKNIWTANENDLAESFSLFAKYPAEIGETYQGWMDFHGNVTVVSTGYNISVAAGDFNCYYYKIDFSTSTWHFYLAPNVGWIKVERFYDGDSYSHHKIWELNSYVVE